MFAELGLTLNIRNNRNYPIPINVLGGPVNPLDTANAKTEYRWNITYLNLTASDTLTLQYKVNGAAVYSTFSYEIINGNIQSLLIALNTLGIGYFEYYTQVGQGYVSTYNDNYQYGQLQIVSNVTPPALVITMDAGEPFNVFGDPNDVANWNTEFDLPNYGTPFTSVTIDGDIAYLYGGANIDLAYAPFGDQNHIKSVVDNIGCIISTQAQAFEYLYENQVITLPNCTYVAYRTFYGGQNFDVQINLPNVITFENEVFKDSITLTTFNYPTVQTVGANCFEGCVAATLFNLSACTDLGGTTGDDGVFQGITGQSIDLYVPSALMTCNSGNPDGDIQYLLNNNFVTIYIVDGTQNFLLTEGGGFLLQEDGGYLVLQEY